MSTLHLTAAEQAAYDTLSSELRANMTVENETLTAYESDDVLRVRMSIARFHKFPVVEKIIEQLKAGATPDSIDLGSIPEDMLPTFFFTIGAKGIDALVMASLKEAKSMNDMQALAVLTEIRHDILSTNSSVTYL